MNNPTKRKEHERENVGPWIVQVYKIDAGHFDVEVLDETGTVRHISLDHENPAKAAAAGAAWADNHRPAGAHGELVAGVEWNEKTQDYTGYITGPKPGDVDRFTGYQDREAGLREMVALAEARAKDASAPDPAPVTADLMGPTTPPRGRGLLKPAEESALEAQAEAVAQAAESRAEAPAEAPAEPSVEDVAAAAKEAEVALFGEPKPWTPAPVNADEVWSLLAALDEAQAIRDRAALDVDRAKAHLKSAEEDLAHARREALSAFRQVNRQRSLPLAPVPKTADQVQASPIAWAHNGRDFKIAWVRTGERFHVEATDGGRVIAEDIDDRLEVAIERVKSAVADLHADVDPGEKPEPKRGRGKGKKVEAPSSPAGAPKTTPKKGGPGRGGRRPKASISAEVTEG